MATVLLTGSEGNVGRAAKARLEADGWSVRSFDLTNGDDLRDEQAVLSAVLGCNSIVHAGAIAHDTSGTPADIVATNVLGTWHVLLAAEHHHVARVGVLLLGAGVGFAEGEDVPAYLPVDDQHPVRATRPYGMSKRLAEDMCAAWTTRTGITTIVLRPVMILTDAGLLAITKDQAELGAFVHVDDVATAVAHALTSEISGHHRFILCGPGDFVSSEATRVLGWYAARGWPSERAE